MWPGTVRELEARGTSTVGSRYPATVSEYVTVEARMCVCACV
jgi:hypothetical protein